MNVRSAVRDCQLAIRNAPFRSWFLTPLLLGLLGCVSPPTRMPRANEPERDKEPKVKTIGDITTFANADPIPVSGVGLVTDLEGTGGDAPPGDYRKLLESQLLKAGAENVKEVLASPNNSMVVVSGLIPAGAGRNDPIDVEIALPAQSRTTSLRGGYLQQCFLMNYDSAQHLVPSYDKGNPTLMGHRQAQAEGPVLVGFGEDDDASKLRHGRIWGGGRCIADRSIALILNDRQKLDPVAQRVADRINESFHGPARGMLVEVAHAQTGNVVYLNVPHQYRHNLPHFMRVVRLIPLDASAEARSLYRRKLAQEVLEPAKTVSAALRLEALGADSIEVLKIGLKSEHPLVRFCSAEALAYLDCSACGQELALLAEQQPELRAYCLTALASLDEAVSHVELRRLLESTSTETRYGAFRGLRALDERDALVRGEFLNNSFWLHRVAPGTAPLVHLSCTRRAEIVVFGDDPQMLPPFSFLAGEFTITADKGDTRCTISRFSVEHGTRRRQCSLKVDDVLHTLADLGGMYPEAFEILRQAGDCRCLTSPVAIDALPQATSVYDLAKKGDELLKVDQEIRNARLEFSSTPNLFDKGVGRQPRSAIGLGEDAVLREGRGPADEP